MTLLLLAGTTEARELAEMLSDEDIPAIASLAGATRAPEEQFLPTRIGGFGGEAGFRAYLSTHGISAVVDATHPFAARISKRTAKVCQQMQIPYCQVLRPAWKASDQDQWTFVSDEKEAASHIGPDDTVFLATGRQSLDAFANLGNRTVYCRQIDPPDRPLPFAKGDYVIGRPPFLVDDEVALFQKLGIDWLVVKNAGGSASFSKLVAARELGLRVIMIERPEQPAAIQVSTANEAMAWVRAL